MFSYDPVRGRGPKGAAAQPQRFRPESWRDPLRTVRGGINEDCSVVVLVAPPGFGKTTFLDHLAATPPPTGRSVDLVRVTPSTVGDWLPPMLDRLGICADVAQRPNALDRLREELADREEEVRTVLVVDDADHLTSFALRELLVVATLAPAGPLRAPLLLCGEPSLLRQIDRLLPARQARSIPRATLPPWSAADIAQFLRQELPQGDRPVRFGSEVAAAVAELTGGRPVTVRHLVMRALTMAAESGQSVISRQLIDQAAASAPWWRSANDDGDSPRGAKEHAGGEDGGTKPAASHSEPQDDEATAPVVAEEEPEPDSAEVPPPVGRLIEVVRDPAVAPGLSEAPMPAVLAPGAAGLPVEAGATAIGLTGAGRRSPARNTLARLMPFAVVVAGVIAAVWALWSESVPVESRLERSLAAPRPTQPAASTDDMARPPVAEATAPAPSYSDGASATAVASSPATAARSEPPKAGSAHSPRPAPESALPPVPEEGMATEAAGWIARGDALVKLGDLSAARQFYLLAGRRGLPAGLTAAATTYDPIYLRQVGVQGARGDARQAIALYRDAIRQGDTAAPAHLAALIQQLRQEGAIDEVEARRLSAAIP